MADQPRQGLWFWVAYPKYTQAEWDETVDALEEGEHGEYWTCDEFTKEGDLALLYRTAPFSEIRWLMRVESDARRISHLPEAQERGWEFGCSYQVLSTFDRTVTYREMSAVKALAGWDALIRTFQGQQGSWPVPMGYWKHLARRLTSRNPGTREVFEAHMRPAPDWLRPRR